MARRVALFQNSTEDAVLEQAYAQTTLQRSATIQIRAMPGACVSFCHAGTAAVRLARDIANLKIDDQRKPLVLKMVAPAVPPTANPANQPRHP